MADSRETMLRAANGYFLTDSEEDEDAGAPEPAQSMQEEAPVAAFNPNVLRDCFAYAQSKIPTVSFQVILNSKTCARVVARPQMASRESRATDHVLWAACAYWERMSKQRQCLPVKAPCLSNRWHQGKLPDADSSPPVSATRTNNPE